jgi:hypothetical protein
MTVDDYFNTPETVKPMELVFGALRVADARRRGIRLPWFKSRVLPEFSQTLDEILANGIVSDQGESGAS